MRVFLTGVTGFAGSHLANRLLAKGEQVFGLVHKESGHQPLPDHQDFTPLNGNILEIDALKDLLAFVKPEVVFHLAGQASPSDSWRNPSQTFLLNVGGTINLLEAVRDVGKPTVINVTSALIYGKVRSDQLPVTEKTQPNPANPYGISKWTSSQIGRLYWMRYQLPVIEARPFNHIGPNQAPGFVVPDFSKQLAAVKLGRSVPEITVGNLSSNRDFTDVRDVVRAYDWLSEHGEAGETYLVCSGNPTKIQHILDILVALAGVEVEVIVDESRSGSEEAAEIFGSYEKLKNATSWEPIIPLRQSLSDALDEWLRYWQK